MNLAALADELQPLIHLFTTPIKRELDRFATVHVGTVEDLAVAEPAIFVRLDGAGGGGHFMSPHTRRSCFAIVSWPRARVAHRNHPGRPQVATISLP